MFDPKVHASILQGHLERELSSWIPLMPPTDKRPIKHKLADQIVDTILKSPIARFELRLTLETKGDDKFFEAHLRRAWSLMFAVLGDDIAIGLLGGLGSQSVIGVCGFMLMMDGQLEREGPQCFTRINVRNCVIANIVESVSRMNGANSSELLERLIDDIPMVPGDRDRLMQTCSNRDHSQVTIH